MMQFFWERKKRWHHWWIPTILIIGPKPVTNNRKFKISGTLPSFPTRVYKIVSRSYRLTADSLCSIRVMQVIYYYSKINGHIHVILVELRIYLLIRSKAGAAAKDKILTYTLFLSGSNPVNNCKSDVWNNCESSTSSSYLISSPPAMIETIYNLHLYSHFLYI